MVSQNMELVPTFILGIGLRVGLNFKDFNQ